MRQVTQFLDEISNKSLLVVFPHPDDESVMVGGLIVTALKMGWRVSVLTLTEGEMGKIHINGKGRSSREIRREEMAAAMSRLGVADWVMWQFADGRLRQTSKWKERLAEFVRITDPGLMVSYDLSGVSGHPDHISLGLEMLRIARKTDTPLLWPSFVGWEREKMVDSRVDKYLNMPNLESELSLRESVRKWMAVFSHRSQKLSGFLGVVGWLAMFLMRKERFAKMEKSKIYRYRYVKFKL